LSSCLAVLGEQERGTRSRGVGLENMPVSSKLVRLS
jgi:hypothetical protein